MNIYICIYINPRSFSGSAFPTITSLSVGFQSC